MTRSARGGRAGSGAALDLLRAPGLGRFLRWVHARTVLQTLMLVLAGVVILDGIFGPQLAPRNLAGVLPWVHWRGFVVVALLVAGNLFCMACPFMLPRRLAKRLLPAARPWPRALRSKWLALALLVVFFWAYESFSLWQSPWLTAWIAATYFAAAFVIDGFFRGASFCKYVCPIGQFNFVHSTVSPLEVRVRDAAVCAGCRTKDCIRGRFEGESRPPRLIELDPRAGTVSLAVAGAGAVRPVQSGCELALFQQRKAGNVDCTFCLDCVHACPHGNVGIVPRMPGRELWENPWRSGVGRFTDRTDLAALVSLLTFAAFVNAFGMVQPVHRFLDGLGRLAGSPPEPLLLALFFAGSLLLLPAGLFSATAALSRRLSAEPISLVRTCTRYAYGLVPLGMGMWTAHYLFHLLVGALTVFPVLRSHLAGLGAPVREEPMGAVGPLVPEEWLFPIQVLLLQVGLAGTLWVLLRIARREHGRSRRASRAFLPWALLAALLFAAGIWLLLQPMEMRGTSMMHG